MAKEPRQPIRVLIVEDSDDDARLLLRHLLKGNFEPQVRRVQTGTDMSTALVEEGWDVVLADNSMPGFSALAALQVLKRSGRDIPFIIVSGEIDDAAAVAAMKAGAQDYLLKDNLARLVPAIQRETREAQVRAARRQAEDALRYQAHHDPLTGLLNRREFEHRVQQALDNARREQSCHVLCYLDLDQFKLVNDTCGHGAGDEMLKQVAVLLGTHLRSADVLARLGGDEFGLLLEGMPAEAAGPVLSKLRDALREFRFYCDGRGFEVGASIGLVEITAHSPGVAELLSTADVACYTAKELGRNRTHLYQPDDENLLQRRREMHWASRITQALDQDRLVLFQQPIVALHAGVPQGPCLEVLVRLQDEDGELVLPGSFIPAAERYKLMPAVDRWVVSHLFAHLEQALADGRLTDGALVFINLSGATINDDGFLGFVQGQIAAHGIRPQQLCFEVTESVAIANLANALHFFNKLKALGCSFALDDFGSGLSSFGYLKNLPVDFLKIDGSFIRDLASDAIDHAMVEAINHIGHVMRLRTVAESVEDDRTLDLLRRIGIDYVQGYALGRPAPLT